MADAKSKEEREREWWAAWRAADFSWDGLARKKWEGWSVGADGVLTETERAPEGARPATLQDYWRDEEAELIEGDGKRWTRAHCPLAWSDGTPAPKADWSEVEWAALASLLSRKLGEAAETNFSDRDSRMLVGADRRAQFQRCVLHGAPIQLPGGKSPFSLRLDGAHFIGHANFDGAVFAGGAGFSNTLFSAPASFVGATFSGDANFQDATFFGNVRFSRAAFSGEAKFERAILSSSSSFERATFSKYASFERAAFLGTARFESAAFSNTANFENVTFFGYTVFISTTFSKLGGFPGATFSGPTRFDEATFSGHATFANARFAGTADLKVKQFGRTADFVQCLFSDLVWFDGVKFVGDMDFTAAVFEKLSSFEGITWPDSAQGWHGAFDQALFRGTAIFIASGFKALAAFDGATFERGVQIDDVREDVAQRTFSQELRDATVAAKTDVANWSENEGRRRVQANNGKPSAAFAAEIAAKVRDFREARLKQLERGCRVLKQAMEYSSNKTREQMFYRFELLARRAQRNTPFWEKVFSHLYGWSSDYGASMARPFAALGVVIVGFAAIFYAFALVRGLGHEDALLTLWQALDFSLANAFKPLSALSADAITPGTLAHRLLEQSGYGWSTGVRIIAIAESLFAIVLAFLFALAVRRRFQIS